jgi:hypothetical protein
MSMQKEILHHSWVSWQRVFNNFDRVDLSVKEIREKQKKVEELLRGYLSLYKEYSVAYTNQFFESHWTVDTFNDKDYDLQVDLRITIEVDVPKVVPGTLIVEPSIFVKTPPPPAQPPAP